MSYALVLMILLNVYNVLNLAAADVSVYYRNVSKNNASIINNLDIYNLKFDFKCFHSFLWIEDSKEAFLEKHYSFYVIRTFFIISLTRNLTGKEINK